MIPDMAFGLLHNIWGDVKGGSGVAFIEIPTALYKGVSSTTGSPIVTVVGANTILEFTQTGSFTL
jgi:hypothetical protein